ncbi:MAG TPA: GNAT family protein [Polyangiales bacterium]|nr:GNAT family protein [Polyangiales bacterium]
MDIRLTAPSTKFEAEFLAAVRRSRKLHRPWVSPPETGTEFRSYIRAKQSPTSIGYFVWSGEGELVGVINLSEIVRGQFLSAYLGYYAFSPHHRKGYMRLALVAVVSRAFFTYGLHRVEANIQPRNRASRALVQSVGFRQEGFSPRYLKILGRWRDHERWAVTREEWRVQSIGDDEHVSDVPAPRTPTTKLTKTKTAPSLKRRRETAVRRARSPKP